ncbi:aldehyde oxidase and xanthine dehydrogenase, molybdopterin binding protein [Acidothermus cellulolyticus 11B]|uniref:Aldehyde oxidase and xanthine dehydrogenase, molybdopterin binding protein n=1 Tax=Acidothermus cellulolyticus (strain ATCC 43068 / DSM 8971 / 11B) TaxID=351607 RepID=A0LTB0_ACIC1|nr:molybdopterin cofactor-binding domain-containing protein [Acidothermus cellulolyticus]ABK52670.1 aldehyde oxidase and xanthine dehydrogenase, molybdopterin binding protein [Acidothermus cellulolyticus 11B]
MSGSTYAAWFDRPKPSLERNPKLLRWLDFGTEGRITVKTGKVELGQGILTALAQIAAEELDVDIRRIVVEPSRTGVSPEEGYTAGSLSVQHSGDAIRQACAHARALFLQLAARELGVAAEALRVDDGAVVTTDGRRTDYWRLARYLNEDIDVDPTVAPKKPDEYVIVGRSHARVDIPAKVRGIPRFIHDIRLPGQLFGRVVHPPARVATLVAVDEAAVTALPGVVRVVRENNYLGVVAEREDIAVRAAKLLNEKARWNVEPSLPDESRLVDYLTSAPSEEKVLYESGEPGSISRYLRRRFSRGYIAHASLAPSCGIARWDGDRLTVWTHSQGIYALRQDLARAFGLDERNIEVIHAEGAGAYGHNPADDAAYDAAWLAAAVPGRPVHVMWSREDELSWDPFGAAMVVDVTVGLDPAGAIAHWEQHVWSNGFSSRPGMLPEPAFFGAWYKGRTTSPMVSVDPPLSNGAGSGRNAVPGYAVPSIRVVTHRLLEMPLRTSSLRSLGAHLNVYAIESVIDEVARESGRDPVEFRLSMLSDPRARRVVETVAERAGWGSALPSGGAWGRGLGFARYKNMGAYCAVVADVEAETDIRVRRLTIAVDVGLVVNPDGVRNQIEGGAIQSVSWTTLEQVHFDRYRVVTSTWEDYPILDFSRVPDVDVVLIDNPEAPPVGSGEAATGPTAAAIGNAVADALGVPVRALPLVPENVVAALTTTS